MTFSGSERTKFSTSDCFTTHPVGLLGFVMNTTFVLSVTASRMASRSYFIPGIGTLLHTPPIKMVASL